MTRLVLVGGGHSQIAVLRMFGMDPPPNCHLTVVARDVLAPYSGMLPGYIAGHYTYQQCHIDVRPLAKMAGARLCQSEVDGVDLEKRLLRCPDRPAVPFDLLSINIGSRPAMAEIPGAKEHSLPAKPVDEFIVGWERIVQRVMDASNPFQIVIAGGGAGGVELALTMHHQLMALLQEDGRNSRDVEFTIVTAGPDVMPSHNVSVRRRMRRILNERAIQLHTREPVVEVRADAVVCESGLEVRYDALIWTTQASAQPWIRESGLATDDEGFLLVDETLRSVSHPFVFATGDIASMQKTPRPKSGVYAVRQGPYLTENLRHTLAGEPLVPFDPQAKFLSLISTGEKNAIASRGAWSMEGHWLWLLKDYIDRKFMRKYQMDMTAERSGNGAMGGGADSDEMEMQCAGCGSKVGHTVLHNAIERLESVEHHGVLIGLDAPDDAAVVELPPGKLAVHTVDFFPAIVDDAYLFGQIAANHCLSDIYAMGATPHTALAVVTLPHASEELQSDLLADLLAGALKALTSGHTALVGGHTTEGEKLSFGLSVNGFVDRAALLRKGGMQPGDRLVLTKPLGTGVIFAADMRGQSKGHWLDEAIAAMLQSNKDAAKCVYAHGATACTDVTGFGLAGHLLEMQSGGTVDAELALERIPVFAGALEASRDGISSSLYPHNARAETALRELSAARKHAVYPLLFDPQTAGGLLASIPESKAEACLDALRDAGYTEAALIGRVLAGNEQSPRITLV